MHLNAPFEVPHTMPVLRQDIIVCSPHIEAILIPSLQTPAVALTRSESVVCWQAAGGQSWSPRQHRRLHRHPPTIPPPHPLHDPPVRLFPETPAAMSFKKDEESGGMCKSLFLSSSHCSLARHADSCATACSASSTPHNITTEGCVARSHSGHVAVTPRGIRMSRTSTTATMTTMASRSNSTCAHPTSMLTTH